MDDLHEPLEPSGKTATTSGSWLAPGLGVLAVCLLSLAAYIFIDAKRDSRTVVAINTPSGDQTAKPVDGLRDGDGANQGIEETKGDVGEDPNFDEIKPLSPLSPLSPLDPSKPDAEPATAPAFRPKPLPPRTAQPWAPVPDLVEKSEFGPLPRVSTGGVRPLDAYSNSSGVAGANRVALIIGGLGLSQTGTQRAIADLPPEITLGFSPFGNSLQRWMQMARKENHEVVLQLAMEPLGYPAVNPGPRTLTSKASIGENLQNLRWSLGRMTNYPLVMNYLGAGMSSNPNAMRPILDEIQRRGLGYIDDGSVQTSLALDVAKTIRLPNAGGSIVVDSVREKSRIEARLLALEAVARRRGFAIGTATAFPESVKAIAEWAKVAQKRGILIVPASSLIKDYR